MAKKDFKAQAAAQLDPITQFISAAEQEPPTITTPAADAEPTAEIKEGYKINPLYVEKKTKRVQLVMQPSLYERAKEASQAAGLSFNDYVHKALKSYLDK